MSNSLRIISVVEEICSRQDEVLRELDHLNEQIEDVLKTLSPRVSDEMISSKAA